MSDSFDPYAEWLGIPPAEQPPHHYRLLGLPLFEADAKKIGAEAERRMQHVRSFQLGKHSQASQKLLNQLAGAKVCLLHAAAKTRYDAALAEQLGARVPLPALPPEAPPLLPPAPPLSAEHADTLFDVLQEPATARASNVAHPTRRQLPPTRGIGPILAGIAIVVVLVSLIIIFVSRYVRFGAEGGSNGPAPIVLPESHETATSKLGGKTVVVPEQVVIQSAGHDIELPLARAKLSGPGLKRAADATANWSSPEDRVEWEFLVQKPGFFMIEVAYAADAESAGGTARIELSDQPRSLTLAIRDTGGRDKFATDPVKVVMIPRGGRYTLTVATAEMRGAVLMNLRGVTLRSVTH